MRTEDLGMLGEEREFAKETKRTIKGLRGPLCLRLRSRLLARGKAGEEGRSAGRSRDDDVGHTSIGWHASPRSTTRPFGWTQFDSGSRSMRRHFSVDLTNDMSFWTLWTGSWIVRGQLSTAYRGSKSAKSARILSPLPSSVHDSTDPSSGWSNTMLYSFFARWRG